MGLLDQIRNDVKNITTSPASAPVSSIVFTTPTGFSPAATATVYGIAVKHSTAISEYGAAVLGKTARVTVSETALTALSYPVRDSNHKVAIKGHNVSFVDSAGLTYYGVINSTMPDETAGLIVCILGDKA